MDDMITEAGRKLWASALGAGNNDTFGVTKEATSTTLVSEGAPGWTVNVFAGQDVYAGKRVGTVLSNTADTLTVARWEEPGKRGVVAAASTPAGTPEYFIAAGACPSLWMALSTSEAAPKAEDIALAGELAGGTEKGLGRALATFTYLGANKYEVKATFARDKKDPVKPVLAKIGLFNAQNSGTMAFESLLSSTAELVEVGDSITVTDTVSGS
jgi:hypothetical protein